MKFRPKRKYDLFIGMGMASEKIVGLLSDSTKKIYLGTGTEPDFNNEAELIRLNNLKKRRNCDLKPRRLARFNSKSLNLFDEIVCFGNNFTASTYSKFDCRIKTFNNYAFNFIKFVKKNHEHTKNNFLYFASGGQVHKGLDLLLEVFAKEKDKRLYICSSLFDESDFIECYREELFNLENIHTIGFVDINGDEFYTLCRQCSFVILPSCAEANVGSIVNCMRAGLIPIVSKESGIDTKKFGYTLENCTIPVIIQKIKELSLLSPELIAMKSEMTYYESIQNYNKNKFIESWYKIIKDYVE